MSKWITKKIDSSVIERRPVRKPSVDHKKKAIESKKVADDKARWKRFWEASEANQSVMEKSSKALEERDRAKRSESEDHQQTKLDDRKGVLRLKIV